MLATFVWMIMEHKEYSIHSIYMYMYVHVHVQSSNIPYVCPLQLVRRMPMDDVVILDVDESTIESPHVDDLLSMPPDVVSTLKHVLKKQSSAYGDTVTR